MAAVPACGPPEIQFSGEQRICKGKIPLIDAPSKAEFPAYDSSFVDEVSDGVYQVEDCVDAQNAFGAMIRSYWTATVKYNEDAENFNIQITSFE